MVARTWSVVGVLAFAASLVLPLTASATVIVGRYSGVIASGTATGGFGFEATTNLAGQAIHGTFTYDTTAFTPVCAPQYFSGCYVGSSLTITQTVNGVTETFLSSVPTMEHPLNHASGGLNFYTLGEDDIVLAATGFLGNPATRATNYWTSIGAVVPVGTIASVTDRYATYDGPAQSGGSQPLSSLGFLSEINRTRILVLTPGGLTTNVDFTYDLQTFAIGPAAAGVPEPNAWALMILGFGFAGGALRRRTPARAA